MEPSSEEDGIALGGRGDGLGEASMEPSSEEDGIRLSGADGDTAVLLQWSRLQRKTESGTAAAPTADRLALQWSRLQRKTESRRDEAALIAHLQAGRIAGAGLDVYEHEPHVPEALRAMENVTLLPHLGTAALEVREAMGLMALDNLRAFAEGRPLPNQVN